MRSCANMRIIAINRSTEKLLKLPRNEKINNSKAFLVLYHLKKRNHLTFHMHSDDDLMKKI